MTTKPLTASTARLGIDLDPSARNWLDPVAWAAAVGAGGAGPHGSNALADIRESGAPDQGGFGLSDRSREAGSASGRGELPSAADLRLDRLDVLSANREGVRPARRSAVAAAPAGPLAHPVEPGRMRPEAPWSPLHSAATAPARCSDAPLESRPRAGSLACAAAADRPAKAGESAGSGDLRATASPTRRPDGSGSDPSTASAGEPASQSAPAGRRRRRPCSVVVPGEQMLLRGMTVAAPATGPDTPDLVVRLDRRTKAGVGSCVRISIRDPEDPLRRAPWRDAEVRTKRPARGEAMELGLVWLDAAPSAAIDAAPGPAAPGPAPAPVSAPAPRRAAD